MFGSGINQLKVIHRPCRKNTVADVLSHNPVTSSTTNVDTIALNADFF